MLTSERSIHLWCPVVDDPAGLRCANMACDHYSDVLTENGRVMTFADVNLSPEDLLRYQASKTRSGEQGQQ